MRQRRLLLLLNGVRCWRQRRLLMVLVIAEKSQGSGRRGRLMMVGVQCGDCCRCRRLIAMHSGHLSAALPVIWLELVRMCSSGCGRRCNLVMIMIGVRVMIINRGDSGGAIVAAAAIVLWLLLLMVTVMMVVMVGLLLLVSLLEGRGRCHRVVVASTVMRMIGSARLAQIGAHRNGSPFVVGCTFCLVPMILEPVIRTRKS